MISTGIVRSIDNLGRVVLPKELRNTYSITPDTPLEIFTDGESIVLRKYRAQGACVFCGEISPDAVLLHGKYVCPACRKALGAHGGLFEAIEEAVRVKGRPFLGICVGMQMMATWGREYEDTAGFDWVSGEVTRITPADPALKVPHMGWNDLVIDNPHPVLAGIVTGDHAYFVHGYAFRVAHPADLLAHVEYGGPITAIIGTGTMVGTQFHPEKSQSTGLRLIGNFLRWKP